MKRIIMLVIALISLLVFFNIFQLYQINVLQSRLDNAAADFRNLKEENEKFKNQLTSPVIDVSANIVTRLGAKLFERGERDIYGTISNYVWMTGEVENTGNVSAFVSLSIRITTTKDVEIQEVVLGTLQPKQIVTLQKTIWPEQGDITYWIITPLGYHFL